VGFVDKVALGHVSLRVLRFSLSVSFHFASPYSGIIWKMKVAVVHLINMNINYIHAPAIFSLE
jgi:hypothetical protein